MRKGHEAEGPSLRPLVLVLALFLGALAGAVSTAGPSAGTHLQPEKAAPASHQTTRVALLTAQIEQR
jgi:hypothetical protein